MSGSLLLAAGGLTGCGQPQWQNQLISVNAAATDSAAGYSGDGFVPFSPDGTKVLFTTQAGNLGPTDTNGAQDVYVRNLTAGTVSLVSHNAAGTDSGNGASYFPKLSADGTKVAFISNATDLGPAVAYVGLFAIFVRDLTTGALTLVTVNGAGTATSDSYLWNYELSADGTKVLWPTLADDLGPFDHDRPPDDPAPTQDADDTDVYVRDLTAGTTSLVSQNFAGTDSGSAPTESAWFSADGSKVRFDSSSSDLVPGDTNGLVDAFNRDLATATTTRIMLSPTASVVPLYSTDGTKIAFSTTASDLGPTDSDCSWPPLPPVPCNDVYVHDLTTGVTTLVSHNAAGTDSGNGPSTLRALSPDGTRIVYESWASSLGPADAGFDVDLYVYDTTTGATSLVTVDSAGTDGLNSSNNYIYATFSADLNKVAFGTPASNVVPGDANNRLDVFVRDLTAGTTSLVSHTSSGTTTGNGASLPNLFSPDGRKLSFTSTASDLVPTDTNAKQDIFLATLR